MSKPENVLIIDPAQELKFRGPFTQPVTSHMSLKNPTEKKVAFKIKTTAPKKYCVRPNCGVVEPKSSVEIAICLQPFVFDPNEKNKHKFMVQSMNVPDGEINVEQLWKDVSPDQLMDAKLRCTFETPNEKVVEKNSVSQLTTQMLKSETGGNSDNMQSSIGGLSSSSGGDPNKSFDADFVRATAEVRDLREENSKMHQEILDLKEQLIRLKTMKVDKDISSNVTSAKTISNPYSPPQLGQQQMPIIWVIAAVGMAIFGLILGKFVL